MVGLTTSMHYQQFEDLKFLIFFFQGSMPPDSPKAIFLDFSDAGVMESVNKTPCTLHRFQTKTILFCSVFKKIRVHTYRFSIVFARPHYSGYPY